MRFLRLRARAEDERGVVAVIVALLLVVLGGSAAMTFDLARLRHERHLIQAAVDLGSLAGAGLLPVSDAAGATAAEDTARQVAVQNAPELATSGLSINFACVVSDPEGNGGGDSEALAFACGPAPGVTWSGGWTTKAGKAIHDCNPYGGDLCNTIRVSAQSTVDFYFAPLIGFASGDTGSLRAAACRGFCGGSQPLDMVFVIDRTRSMSDQNIADLKAAIANPSPEQDSVLEFYEPNDVRIGLVALPYPHATDKCQVSMTQNYPNTTPQAWWVSPAGPGTLSSNYQNVDGTLNTTGSDLVQKILCLPRAPSGMTVTPSGAGHTDHGDPITDAQRMLDQAGRANVQDVIVFFADGESNQPRYNQPCSYARAAAEGSKTQGTLFFSLAYGAAGARCVQDTSGSPYGYGPPPSGGDYATKFLAESASLYQGAPSSDDVPGGCGANENTDGDYYFCEARGGDLQTVFLQIAAQAVQRSRLLNFD
jgi:Flp pilus assembly protein TadG